MMDYVFLGIAPLLAQSCGPLVIFIVFLLCVMLGVVAMMRKEE
jgi:hypothetical protein|tara:strand:- start:1526 stop:1654 length:129 start_codon:yes stop_codon:yes gene_type:complete